MANNTTITLIGNVGQDPEVHKNDNGEFVRLSIATTDSYKDEQSGEWKEKEAVWHTIFAFGPQVAAYANAQKAGNRVKVAGTLSYQTTEAMIEGEKRYFNNATIIARRIEPAPLPKSLKKKGA